MSWNLTKMHEHSTLVYKLILQMILLANMQPFLLSYLLQHITMIFF